MNPRLRKALPTAAACLATAGLVAGGMAAGSAPVAASAGINAATLNGLRANEIVRATSVRSTVEIDNFDSCSPAGTLQSTKVTVPGKGYLMVWGNVGAARDVSTSENATLSVFAKVGTAVATNTVATLLTGGGTQDGHVAVSGMVKVGRAGTKTVTLKGQECTDGMAYIANSSIQTLFVPFGSASVVTGAPLRQRNG